MDPPPPRKPKDLPFYQAPDHVKTSSRIISEAKSSLSNRSQLRAINTKRPVTPQEGQRKLFPEQSVRDPTNRPPSAFSLGSRHFDSESRPVSGTRLTPLDHKTVEESIQEEKKPQASVDSDSVMAPKPPTDPNRAVRRPHSRQRMLQHSNSTESNATDMPSSAAGSLQDVSAISPSHGASTSSVQSTPESQRRARSGPKERTKHLLEERGEGDGSEAIPRVDSRISRRRRSRDRVSGTEERAESGYSSDVRENSASSQRGSSGKGGSAGSREPESPDEALYYNTKIGPIVEEMSQMEDKKRLMGLTDSLYSTLEEGHLLGKACKRRAAILKTVFKLLDLDSPKLLLKLARLILALKVSGNNLTNVCKLVFKVSREEKHDSYFLEGNMLELLIEAAQSTDHITSADALVYCVGALKFLSGNTTLLKHLVKSNCIGAMVNLLKNINKTNMEAGKPTESFGHILVQCTACLRNMADVGGTRVQFVQLEAIENLCKVMEVYQGDGDLMLNISRIFSKLTMHTDCCNVLSSQTSHFRAFLHLLKVYQRREDLVVRLSFILGNLTSKSDRARTQLFRQPKALDILVNALKYYTEQDVKAQEASSNEDLGNKAQSKTEDVLIKLIRVIANLSINEDIGPVIATNETCIILLEQMLNMKELVSSEELVLNTIATLNNLSFYVVNNSAIQIRQNTISECLLKYLAVENYEGLAEATRVFGNLSRERPVREFLIQHKVAEMMVVLLDSGKREVVFTACGVLINLMADEESRPMLRREGGIRKLVEVMRDFGRSDWQLASMVCQTLWNYSGKITSSNAFFGEQESAELVELLLEYLDEETMMNSGLNPDFDEAMRDFIHDMWDSEFCPVATQLLNRIEAHSSNFEPLDHPS